MARQQLPPQIKKTTVRDRKTGKSVVRYEIRADAGVNPETVSANKSNDVHNGTPGAGCTRRDTERRRQRHFRDQVLERRARLARRAARHPAHDRRRLEHALAPLRSRHGDIPVQKLSKAISTSSSPTSSPGRYPASVASGRPGRSTPCSIHLGGSVRDW